MDTGIEIGLAHVAEMTVTEHMLVPGLAEAVGSGLETFADMPQVMATAMLVAFVEATCIDCIRPHYGPGVHSVGIHVALDHTAPTLAGTAVRAEVKVTALEKRKVSFSVAVSDTFGPIATGTHQRALIDLGRFGERAAERARGG